MDISIPVFVLISALALLAGIAIGYVGGHWLMKKQIIPIMGRVYARGYVDGVKTCTNHLQGLSSQESED